MRRPSPRGRPARASLSMLGRSAAARMKARKTSARTSFSFQSANAIATIALRAVWMWERTRVVLTTEKLFVVHGTFRRRAAAVRLSRLGAVEIEQSLVGRMMGYGTIVAGELEIDYVPQPRRVYGLVERLSG